MYSNREGICNSHIMTSNVNEMEWFFTSYLQPWKQEVGLFFFCFRVFVRTILNSSCQYFSKNVIMYRKTLTDWWVIIIFIGMGCHVTFTTLITFIYLKYNRMKKILRVLNSVLILFFVLRRYKCLLNPFNHPGMLWDVYARYGAHKSLSFSYITIREFVHLFDIFEIKIDFSNNIILVGLTRNWRLRFTSSHVSSEHCLLVWNSWKKSNNKP